MLKKVAKFRQGGRFPILCYRHRKNGMVSCFRIRLLFMAMSQLTWAAPTRQVIMRSSQPLTGPNRKRCREDESLLQAVMDGSDKGYIIDTRSSQQAQQARMAGGGFESKSCYSCWKRLHRPMEKWVSGGIRKERDRHLGGCLHVMMIFHVVSGAKCCRRVWSRWWKPAETDPTAWTAGSASWRIQSGWLTSRQLCPQLGSWQSVWRGESQTQTLSTSMLQLGMTTSSAKKGVKAWRLYRDGHSVLIHGSDGKDSTLVISTLAQLIMDPCCRTLEGFLALVEREWIQVTHTFVLECMAESCL